MPGNASLQERREAYRNPVPAVADPIPGLAVDLAGIAADATCYALALLDAPDGDRAAILGPSRGTLALFHGGIRPNGPHTEIFERPFEQLTATVTRVDPCPVCGFHSGSSS